MFTAGERLWTFEAVNYDIRKIARRPIVPIGRSHMITHAGGSNSSTTF